MAECDSARRSIENSAPIDQETASRWISDLRRSLQQVFLGSSTVSDVVLSAWLARGHVLLEDRPGVGKTTLAKALSAALGGHMQRVQGSPDLTPSDIIGISVFDEHERTFVFQPGPIFSDILMVDEMNRCPPRCLSALLEAMAEQQVSVDGKRYPLADDFFCIATQNHFDSTGTFPVPQSQLDRFMIRTSLGYPSAEQEIHLLSQQGGGAALLTVTPQLDPRQQQQLRHYVRQIHVDDSLLVYLVSLVRASRAHVDVVSGISPRAALDWQFAAQAWACLAGRDFVTPDDLLNLAQPVLAHRFYPKAGIDAITILNELLENQPVPR